MSIALTLARSLAWTEIGPGTEVALTGAACLLLAATTTALWLILAGLKRMERRLSHLDRLAEIEGALRKFQEEHGALDLRRLEHVLIDIRDGQKRVEDRTLAVLEAARAAEYAPGALEVSAPASGAAAGAASATALADRIVTRLLALGYERVQLVTPLATVAEFLQSAAGDGDVSVEARRDGAACKGRILVRRGAIADVQLQSAYSTFP